MVGRPNIGSHCGESNMGSLADLTLGRPPFQGFKRLAFSVEHMGKISRIEDYLKSLEDERKKIEAFKRELPICMQLLSDEIEVSKKQLSNCNHEEDLACSKSKTPFLEEFIPLKTSTQGSTFETIVEDRDNLTPVHQNGRLQTTFWSQAEAYDHGQEMVLSMTDKPYKKRAILCFEEEQACSHGTAKPDLSSRLRPGGAFLPFPRDSRRPPSDEVAEMSSPSHGDHEEVSPSADHLGRSSPGNEGANLQQCKGAHNAAAVSANIGSQRKPRRCWSPELHRRFVNALQQLGGSEVATPKQIRELMQVDGLTNDEVKSHLQKYRLHTRRPNPGFQPAAAHTPHVVVLGGIWVPQDYAISQNPQSLYIDPAQAEQTLHQEQPFSEGHMYTQQNASIQSFYHDHHHGHDHELRQRNAATPSQGSSQGPLQYDVAAHSSDAGGKEEEGLREDGNEGSSWRAGSYQEELRLNGHRHSDAHEWRYAPDSGEDDSEAEDGKVRTLSDDS